MVRRGWASRPLLLYGPAGHDCSYLFKAHVLRLSRAGLASLHGQLRFSLRPTGKDPRPSAPATAGASANALSSRSASPCGHVDADSWQFPARNGASRFGNPHRAHLENALISSRVVETNFVPPSAGRDSTFESGSRAAIVSPGREDKKGAADGAARKSESPGRGLHGDFSSVKLREGEP